MCDVTSLENSRGAFITRGARSVCGRRQGVTSNKPTWISYSKLGQLVRQHKVNSLDGIRLTYRPVREYGVFDIFIGEIYNNALCLIKPLRENTPNGRRYSFKVHFMFRDIEGHLGLGVVTHADISVALRDSTKNAIITSLAPIRMGNWRQERGKGPAHTVPCVLVGKCASVVMQLLPAPRGTGIIAGPLTKRVLKIAGFKDCIVFARGHTEYVSDFIDATYAAIRKPVNDCNRSIKDNIFPLMSSLSVFTDDECIPNDQDINCEMMISVY